MGMCGKVGRWEKWRLVEGQGAQEARSGPGSQGRGGRWTKGRRRGVADQGAAEHQGPEGAQQGLGQAGWVAGHVHGHGCGQGAVEHTKFGGVGMSGF